MFSPIFLLHRISIEIVNFYRKIEFLSKLVVFRRKYFIGMIQRSLDYIEMYHWWCSLRFFCSNEFLSKLGFSIENWNFYRNSLVSIRKHCLNAHCSTWICITGQLSRFSLWCFITTNFYRNGEFLSKLWISIEMVDFYRNSTGTHNIVNRFMSAYNYWWWYLWTCELIRGWKLLLKQSMNFYRKAGISIENENQK